MFPTTHIRDIRGRSPSLSVHTMISYPGMGHNHLLSCCFAVMF